VSYRTAPAPEPPPPAPCLGCFHPEHRGACPTCHSRCVATRVCGRLPHALVVHAVALATLGAVWELFRPFAKMHVPWVLVFGLFATWARRRGYLATRDNEETFVRVDLESESPARDVSFDAALERGANIEDFQCRVSR